MAGGLAILVAEDDEGVARLLQTLLEQDGHTVTVVANGYQALELARAGRFDVLLLDVMMPGLTGDAVARQAWLDRPELPVGFITGDYGLDLVEGLGPILRKPFRDQQLREFVDLLSPSGADRVHAPLELR